MILKFGSKGPPTASESICHWSNGSQAEVIPGQIKYISSELMLILTFRKMNIVLISTNCAHFKHYKSLTIISFYKADNEKKNSAMGYS